MKKLFSVRTRKSQKKGFSLMELAIVLGVMGLILGSIWAMITVGRSNALVEQTVEQIGMVATNVRGFYGGGYVGMPNQGYGTITVQLLQQNIAAIPAYMQRAGTAGCVNPPTNICADTLWGPNSGSPPTVDAGGTFRVCNWTGAPSYTCNSTAPGSTSQFFGIMLTGLTNQACQQLVTKVSSGGASLSDVMINGNSMMAQTPPKSVQPVNGTDAINFCQLAPSGAVGVVFVYPLVAHP